MNNQRYSTVAICLHWAMAIVILALLISGIIIHEELIDNEATLFWLFQWHKSLGVTALVLIIFRLIWRLFNRPPELVELSDKQQRLAGLGHKSLYLLLVLMPLSGWLMVSSSDTGIPTIIFNAVHWPHLPVANNAIINELASLVHHNLAWLLFMLIVGHIAMVVIHARQGHALLARISLQRYSATIVATFVLSVAGLSLIDNSSALTQQADTSDNIGFSGVHAGKNFTGRFEKWSITTDFEDAKAEFDEFHLIIESASAITGNNFYDETLAETDWLNPTEFATIEFKAEEITRQTENTFELVGDITIKGQRFPQTFIAEANQKTLTAKLNLSRLKLGIGVAADPDAEWVGDLIKIDAKWQKK